MDHTTIITRTLTTLSEKQPMMRLNETEIQLLFSCVQSVLDGTPFSTDSPVFPSYIRGTSLSLPIFLNFGGTNKILNESVREVTLILEFFIST